VIESMLTQDLGPEPFELVDDREQEVLGADRVAFHTFRFVDTQLDDLSDVFVEREVLPEFRVADRRLEFAQPSGGLVVGQAERSQRVRRDAGTLRLVPRADARSRWAGVRAVAPPPEREPWLSWRAR